jgi:hypothetical protein
MVLLFQVERSLFENQRKFLGIDVSGLMFDVKFDQVGVNMWYDPITFAFKPLSNGDKSSRILILCYLVRLLMPSSFGNIISLAAEITGMLTESMIHL